MDRALIDRHGRRAGRVDDLLFEVRQGEKPKLILRELLSGPLPRAAPRWLAAALRLWYRAIGVARPHPSRIDWSGVRMVDAMVHLDADREAAHLRVVDQAMEKWIRKLPRAGVKP